MVDEFNYTFHREPPVDIKTSIYIDFGGEDMIKILNLKLVIMWQTVTLQIGQKKFLRLKKIFKIKKVKNTVPWTYVIGDLNGKEVVGTFNGKHLTNQNQTKINQTEFRIEEVTKDKDKLYGKWKCYYGLFNSWVDKKLPLYKISYYRIAYLSSETGTFFSIKADILQYIR